MKRLWIIHLVLSSMLMSTNAYAQLKIVPKDKLQSVVSPTLSPDSALFLFDVKNIKAAMAEGDTPSVYRFSFRNSGNRPFKMLALRTTCSCLTAVCDKAEVKPGEKAVISATYNPKGHPGKFERRIFVYTQEGTQPSAVLSLSVDVSAGDDFSKEFPVQMGNLRLRRDWVRFSQGVKGVEKIRFKNVADKTLTIACEHVFLPEGISFEASPKTVSPGEVGELRVTYDPDKFVNPSDNKEIKLMLKGLGLPPSKSVIRIEIE